MLDQAQARAIKSPDATRPLERRRQAWRFRALVVVAAVGFVILAALAYSTPYFALDLSLTRALQSIQAPWFGALLHWVGWIGFPPQSNVIWGLIILALFLVGWWLEALGLAFAAVGSAILWFQLAPLFHRPRPSPDLVQVAQPNSWGSFPSGHALNLSAIFGYLVYLAYTRMQPGWRRNLVMTLLALPILTIGLARVYAGAHWPSDVLGGYLLGLLWLAPTIQLYRWTRHRLTLRRRHETS